MKTREAVDTRYHKAIISFGFPAEALNINSNFTGEQKADLYNEGSAFFLSFHLKGVKKWGGLTKEDKVHWSTWLSGPQ